MTISQATPAIDTTPLPAGGTVGISIFDTARVTGGFDPTGTVTFELFGPGNTTCAAPPVFTSPDNELSGSPLTATSGSFTPTALGTYRWVAVYNGDANNISVSSVCTEEPVQISADPGITKTVTSNTQNPDGTWTIVYDVEVTNPNPAAINFTLTDTLNFGQNIHVNSATVTGPAVPNPPNPSWNGTTDTVVAQGASLGPPPTTSRSTR